MDSRPLTVLDIRKGSTLDYDFTNWKAVGEHNYYWGEDTYSRLFTLSARGKTIYLEIDDEEEEMGLAVFEKIPVHRIAQDFPRLYKQGNIPQTLDYNQKTYHFVSEDPGEWRDRGEGGDWETFTVWDYEDETGEQLLSIERWEGDEWEAYAGHTIEEHEISNITRPKKTARSNRSGSWISKNIGCLAVFGFFGLQFLVCGTCEVGSFSDSSNTIYSQSAVPTVEGINEVIKNYDYLNDFTIVLNDMNYDNKQFQHQYEVIIPDRDSIRSEMTGWKGVSAKYFRQHKDHLGLEIAAKKDGLVMRDVAPPGFSQYVGNEQYGEWKEDNGRRSWFFFPRYMYLGNIFYRNYRRPAYSSFTDYNTNGRGRTGYFTNNTTYNTRNYMNTAGGRNTRWASLPTSIRDRLHNEPLYNSSSSGSRTSRSGSRYSNNRSRSRSGGFGK